MDRCAMAKSLHCFQDAFIVSCYNYAGAAHRQSRTLIHSLHHRFASNLYQWLARQTRTAITRGNDNDYLLVAHVRLIRQC